MADFFCDVFGWGCPDHGVYVSHAAPEIHVVPLLCGVLVVLGVLCIWDEARRGRR